MRWSIGQRLCKRLHKSLKDMLCDQAKQESENINSPSSVCPPGARSPHSLPPSPPRDRRRSFLAPPFQLQSWTRCLRYESRVSEWVIKQSRVGYNCISFSKTGLLSPALAISPPPSKKRVKRKELLKNMTEGGSIQARNRGRRENQGKGWKRKGI